MNWIPFDSVWIVEELKQESDCSDLIAQLLATERVMLKQNPQDANHLIYYFHDPLSSQWAVARSQSIECKKAEFLFNFLPGGALGALQVWFRDSSLTQ